MEPTLPGSSQVKQGFDKTSRFLTGKEQINRDRAIELYREGDQLFRQAASLNSASAEQTYARAGKLFARSAEAFPGSALEQDAIYMAGQSYFFANQLTTAEEYLGKLQHEHPRNRHSERAERLLIAIAQYWIETDKAGAGNVIPVNFTDDTRPWTDSSGHAIRVLDQLRYDDPTGQMTDDATMMIALEHMRQSNYFDADQVFTDLRELFPDSTHVFNAHLLGLQCKLAMYAGANYSGLALEEAQELIDRIRRVYPNELQKPEVRQIVAQSAAQVEYLQAEKLWNRASYREKQANYGGAKIYYDELLEKFPNTPFAQQARERLVAIQDKPEVRPQRLAFLAKLFPPAQPQKPLFTTEGEILRR